MNMLRHLRNQSGSSILSAIVMGSIIVAGGLYFAKEHTENTRSVKTDELSFEVILVGGRVLEQLGQPQTCLKTLGTSDVRTKVINEIKNIADTVILDTTNKISNNNLSVDKIELKGEFVPATQNYKTIENSFGATPIPAGESRYGKLNILISIRKEFEKVYGAKVLTKKFPIIVKVNENYQVLKCFGTFGDLTENVREQSCIDFGGVYNLNTGCTLTGGNTSGQKIKNASCEIFGGSYNETTGKCENSTFKTMCPAGQYIENFDLAESNNTCISFP